jgi:hypothetical protein
MKRKGKGKGKREANDGIEDSSQLTHQIQIEYLNGLMIFILLNLVFHS